MSSRVEIGNPLPITAVLSEQDGGKFVRARVYDSSGSEVAGSPFSLSHVAEGFYISNAYTPTVKGTYIVNVQAYDDAGFTTLSAFGQSEEKFWVEETNTSINDNIDSNEGRAI